MQISRRAINFSNFLEDLGSFYTVRDEDIKLQVYETSEYVINFLTLRVLYCLNSSFNFLL